MAFERGVALTENGQFISGMGVDFRDIDNDGLPDIAFVALNYQTFPLFRNLGRGFDDVTVSSGMARLSLPMAGYSPTLADFDNDGWKDLLVTGGHVEGVSRPDMPMDQHNVVFQNLGDSNSGRSPWKLALPLSPADGTVDRRLVISTAMESSTS